MCYYFKVLRKDLCHRGFQYKLGLNVDDVPFDPSGSCKPGGLYISDLEHLHRFFDYGELIGEIELPADAQVYREPGDLTKLKVDKLILKNIVSFGEFALTHVDHISSSFFRALRYEYKTPELCKKMVERFPHLIEVVPPTSITTFAMCQRAVECDPSLFGYIPEKFRTREVCEVAVANSPSLVVYVPNEQKTDEFYTSPFFTSKPDFIKYIPTRLVTLEMCEKVVLKDPKLIEFVPAEFVSAVLLAVPNYALFKVIKKKLCKLSRVLIPTDYEWMVQQDYRIFSILPDTVKTKDMCITAVSRNPFFLRFVPNHLRTPEIRKLAIDKNPKCEKFDFLFR
jgi:hypothetical protein